MFRSGFTMTLNMLKLYSPLLQSLLKLHTTYLNLCFPFLKDNSQIFVSLDLIRFEYRLFNLHRNFERSLELHYPISRQGHESIEKPPLGFLKIPNLFQPQGLCTFCCPA